MDELTRLFLVVENSLVNIDSGCLKQGGGSIYGVCNRDKWQPSDRNIKR